MQPDARALRVLTSICALLVACTPPSEPLASSGSNASAWSSIDGAKSASATKSARKGERWEHFDEVPRLRKAIPRLRSNHFAGDLDAEVLANEQAAAYPDLGPNRNVAPSAILVEALYAQGSDVVAAYLAMIKIASTPEKDAWTYVVLKPSGEIEEEGQLPLCERCHAEAPHNHLYGRGQ